MIVGCFSDFFQQARWVLRRVACFARERNAQCAVAFYAEGYASRAKLMNAFTAQGLRPRIIFDANDIEAMKKYVRSGLGIAVVNDGAIDDDDKTRLTSVLLDGNIGATTLNLGVRRDAILGRSAYRFIGLLKPSLDRTGQGLLSR